MEGWMIFRAESIRVTLKEIGAKKKMKWLCGESKRPCSNQSQENWQQRTAMQINTTTITQHRKTNQTNQLLNK